MPIVFMDIPYGNNTYFEGWYEKEEDGTYSLDSQDESIIFEKKNK